jgi:hypothetical protein
MPGDSGPIAYFNIHRLRGDTLRLAVYEISITRAFLQISRLRYGDAAEQASYGGVKNIVIQCSTANRAERICQCSRNGCQGYTRC